jgi:hypothetical protein
LISAGKRNRMPPAMWVIDTDALVENDITEYKANLAIALVLEEGQQPA